MFFQTFSKKQFEERPKTDLCEQLQFIVNSILNYELPTHYSANHILFTANIRLSELKELASNHRKNINLNTSIGTFHKNAYELLSKKANQLDLIIESYIIIHKETDRNNLNHRLRLIDDKIIALYNELIEFNNQTFLPQLVEQFWQAFKDDLMPILAELRT